MLTQGSIGLRNIQIAWDSLVSLLNEEVFAVPVMYTLVGANVGSGAGTNCDAAMMM